MEPEIKTISELLDQLREPSGGKKRFEDLLPDARRLFRIDNLDLVSLEVLLIQAITSYALPNKDDKNSQYTKDDAKKLDACLLAFGLLDGYYHTKKNGNHYKVPQRQEDYLRNSDYIKLFYIKSDCDRKATYKTAKGGLSKIRERCRDDLATRLSNPETCISYLQEGKRNFIKNGQVQLPKPSCTLKNFPPSIEAQEVTKRSLANLKIIYLLVFVIVMIAAIMVCVFIKEQRLTALILEHTERITPEEIKIINKNIELTPGEDAYLIVETKPLEFNPNYLRCISSNPDIVSVENIHSKHIIATDQIMEDMPNEVTIIVQDESGTKQATANIHVVRPGERISFGQGKTESPIPDDLE